MTKKENKSGIDEKQIVIFKIAKEEFGVDIYEVKEIIKMEDITPIPNTDGCINGVINLRGRIIVVVSLAKKLGLPIKCADKDTRIIIVEIGENVVGMIVDSMEEVLHVSGDHISNAPQIITRDIGSDYIQGVCVLSQRLIILLDMTLLLNQKDVMQINKISDTNRKTNV